MKEEVVRSSNKSICGNGSPWILWGTRGSVAASGPGGEKRREGREREEVRVWGGREGSGGTLLRDTGFLEHHTYSVWAILAFNANISL